MKTFLLQVLIMLSATALFGCAQYGGSTQSEDVSISNGVELECKSANRLGCRHKGNLYPWNAWAEVKGYDSVEYEIKEVNQSGNKATVLIVKR